MLAKTSSNSVRSPNFDDSVKLLQSGNYQFTHPAIQDGLCAGREWCRFFTSDLESVTVTQYTSDIARQYVLGDRSKFRGRVVYEIQATQRRLLESAISTIESVRFPLSFFASNPVAFRRAYWQEWLTNFIAHQEAKRAKRSYLSKPLRLWNAIELLDLPGAQDLFEYENDVSLYGSSRNIHDVPVPRVEVQLPQHGFPQMRRGSEIARQSVGGTMVRSTWRFSRRTGYARHEIDLSRIHSDRPLKGRIVRWTPGLLLGSPMNHPDYLLGATVIMLASRAQELIGESFGKAWMMRKDDIVNPKDAPWVSWYDHAAYRLAQEVPEATEHRLKPLTAFMI